MTTPSQRQEHDLESPEESYDTPTGPKHSSHKADERTKRRNLLTALVLTLFFMTLITIAILGPNFFQKP